MKPILSLLIVLAAIVPASPGQIQVPRREPNKIIYDFANLLDAQALASIEAVTRPLFQHKRPIIILTIPSLAQYGAAPDQIERFASSVYNSWGIGTNTTGNIGALIVVSKGDRTMWIEPGKAVSGQTEKASQIAKDTMAPNFKEGDWAGGIREGAIAIRDRMFQPLTGEDLQNLPVEPTGAPSSDSGAPGDIGLPGPGGPPSGGSGGTNMPPSQPPPSRPRSDSGGGGLNLNMGCGNWVCLAIGALVLISFFKRRRRNQGYGYGPPPGGPPQYGPGGYGHQQRSSGGLGGMLGGILTGALLGRMGGRGGGGGGGGMFGGGGGSSGSSGGGGGSVFGGGSSGGGGGGGGGFGGGFGGGSSSGGGAGASW